MKISIGADHAGVSYKRQLAEELRATGHTVIDLGTEGTDSVDYPDFAHAVATSVATEETERGILICGSAVGVSITANKVPGIRAGVCHDTYSAAQGVDHDDMNVLCLGERVIGIALAHAIVDAFLEANFSEAPRHQRRLDKVLAIEEQYLAT
jgi:ribose 5-phosphate isomerase B